MNLFPLRGRVVLPFRNYAVYYFNKNFSRRDSRQTWDIVRESVESESAHIGTKIWRQHTERGFDLMLSRCNIIDISAIVWGYQIGWKTKCRIRYIHPTFTSGFLLLRSTQLPCPVFIQSNKWNDLKSLFAVCHSVKNWLNLLLIHFMFTSMDWIHNMKWFCPSSSSIFTNTLLS
jgi:hypothetical protein